MANIFIEESTMQAIGDAIREKTGKFDGILPADMPAEIQSITSSGGEGYEEGVQAEKVRFWNTYQTNGNRTNYLYAFAGAGWTDATYNPQYPLKIHTNGQRVFYGSSITNTKVPIDIALPKTVPNVTQIFDNASKLQTIPELIVNQYTRLHASFADCGALANIDLITGKLSGNGKNVVFGGCPCLTKKSIENIVNALSDTPDTDGLSVTFNTDAVNKAFETSEGVGDGATSSEWLALVASKSNWSFVV